jgi:hypothetical protein
MHALSLLRPRSFLGSAAVLLLSTLVLPACGGDDGSTPPMSGAGGRNDAGANDHEGGTGAGKDAPGAAGGDMNGGVPLGEGQQLVPGSPSVVGVTGDDWVLYREGDVLKAIPMDGGDVLDVSDEPGNVLLRGKVVFNFGNVDWTKNVGNLSIWTAAGGAQEVGKTTYSEALISASSSGEWLVYPADTRGAKTNLMLASNDFSTNDVLIEEMGLGNDSTCSPSLGFVGERLFVGYCEPDSREAKVVRFERDGKSFSSTMIAEQALPTWSADAAGDGVFFQSDAYQGWYAAGGEQYFIDASVSRGFLMPDGSAVLYTVGDQLRRSSVPESNPVPIVTTGFAEPVAFTSDYSAVLYSSRITYENGTQRDLRLVATDGFNPEPIELVAEPVAAVGRSSLTDDGQYVLFLDEVTPNGGTLHVVDIQGKEVVALPGVLDVLAAHGSSIVFTDNGSDPEVYPNVADLEVLDVAMSKTPTLVEARIMETKNFQLDSTLTRVMYVRSGVDRDPEDPQRTGIFWQDLP